jgi:membrane protein DedA with SNARE-associated domain
VEEELQRLIEGLGQAHPGWTYGVLALSALLENLVPPVPGDMVVVFSAFLVGRGVLQIWPAYLATCLGGTVGFMVMYALGRCVGRPFLAGPGRRWFAPALLARAEGWLARYGLLLILGNRFLSGVRSVIAVAAGAGGMDWRRVGVGAVVSMAVWNGLLFVLGGLVGRNWQAVTGALGRLQWVMGAAVVGAAGLAWVWHRRRKGKRDLTVRK